MNILFTTTTFITFLSLNQHHSLVSAETESLSDLDRFFLSTNIETSSDHGLKPRSHLNDDWTELSVGMMVKRSDEDQFSSNLTRRDETTTPVGRTQSNVLLARNTSDGKLIVPSSRREAAKMALLRARQKAKRTMSVMITWYNGYDLLNPACVQGGSGWAPTDQSMAAAVTIAWSNKPACGKFVKIRHSSNHKKFITVRIVDSCGGCASGSAHIDLTTGAFQKLYGLDVGLVEGLQAKIVKTPKGIKWTDADVAKYGPQYL